MLMNRFTLVYGIDVSKDSLDIVQLSGCGQQEQVFQVSNRTLSIRDWISTLGQEALFCVFEATGTYSAKLAFELDRASIRFAQVNPLRSKYFMEAIGLQNKTDYLAARSLALMGLQLDLKPYKMPSINNQQRAQLQQALQAMQKQRQMLKNQIHALDQRPFVVTHAKAAFQQTLQTIDQQIQQLQQELDELEEEEDFSKLKAQICSVVGIGEKTAEAILITTNNLQTFDAPQQLASFLGLTPKSHYSGSSIRRRGRISKQGPHYIRRLLYMCTRSAIRYNLACKALYEKLRKKGKPYKVALVAVMHKLVKQLFVCVKKQVFFDNQYELNNIQL